VISPLTNEEKTKLQQVYTAALQSSSSLDAEGDALAAKMTAYQTALKAAMVKTDPAVAPALAKMSGSPLTQAESHEIRQAQSRAMQADPDLQSQWDDLTEKMTAHQRAVDAAMLKLDPAVASILAKLSP
jgi:FtsZ-binding cell division protein ZapB